MGLLGTTVKANTDISDEVLANNMLATAGTGASAYLAATLASTTPELKAMYSSALNQVVAGHSALIELATKRGWDKPYDAPTQQLADAYQKAQAVIRDKR